MITVERHELVKAFNEWMRRYQEKPDEFLSLAESTKDYGEVATDYLVQILHERGMDMISGDFSV